MAKILFVSSKDYNYYNFRSKFILKLVELGHEVVLVCPYGDKIPYFTDRGCRFVPLEMDRRGTSFLNDFKLILGYKKIFQAEKPDIVLTYTGKSSTYGGLVCRWLKIHHIINNAGLMDTRYYSLIVGIVLNILYRLGFRKADCMMYQNSQERDYLNKCLKNKVHYRDLPGSGVDLTLFEFKEYPKENMPIIFNYVGRLVSIKGIREFLDCAEAIHPKYSNTRFRIYGEYDDLSYKQRVEELQSKGIVEYMGQQLDMKPCIENASAVIHASYYEGMTNVVLEHSAMGRVCIGANIPGIKEGIDDGRTGYLFPVTDSDALITVVEKFIRLPYEEKMAMGKAAREKMEREFDRNIVTNIYLEEIEKILSKK